MPSKKDLSESKKQPFQSISKFSQSADFTVAFFVIPKSKKFEDYLIVTDEERIAFELGQIFQSIGIIEIFEYFDLLVCVRPYVVNLQKQKL